MRSAAPHLGRGRLRPRQGDARLSGRRRLRANPARPAFIVAPAALQAAFKLYLQGSIRFRVKFLDVFARGPPVTTHRIDTVVTPGKPDQDMEILGVFLLKGGQIPEWTDHTVGRGARPAAAIRAPGKRAAPAGERRRHYDWLRSNDTALS